MYLKNDNNDTNDDRDDDIHDCIITAVPLPAHPTLASAPCSNEIPLVEMSNSGELGEEPVSTLGTPMRLFGKHTLPYGHSAAVRRPFHPS